jgi:hypothetical protein
VKRNERFGPPGLRKRGPRPAPVFAPTPALILPDPPPSRWSVRLRSLGGWLMSSRFGFLRSLGGRLLRTGSFFSPPR